MDGHSLIYGIARADPKARHALDAFITIDASRFLFLPGDCISRTLFKTAATLDAGGDCLISAAMRHQKTYNHFTLSCHPCLPEYQWSVVSDQWSVVSNQWSVVSNQWSVVSDW